MCFVRDAIAASATSGAENGQVRAVMLAHADESTPTWSAKTASSTTFRMTRGWGSTLPSSSMVTVAKGVEAEFDLVHTDPNLPDCQADSASL